MLSFTKMHGLGNDYVYLDCTRSQPEDLPALARRVSDRHFGVGSDGLICVCPSERADLRMRMFNADGSEGEMCGNGIRCVGKFAYDKGLTAKTSGLAIETLGGIKYLELTVAGGKVSAVTVDMGRPVVEPPIGITVKGKYYTGIPVSMGNPHLVVFQEEIGGLGLEEIGPVFEHCDHFPRRVNTEFVAVADRAHLDMRVWERGSGETLACGTGACAALAAAVTGGLAERRATVRLLGGELELEWAGDGRMFMTGPAVTVFEGELL